MHRLSYFGRFGLIVLAVLFLSLPTIPILAQNTGFTSEFGSSGGNVNNITARFCCSGTLGSLVTDGTNKYILSNNHVLADSDTGHIGDNISQPGLVDVGCNASLADIVATLTAFPHLGTNVDAAIAQLTPTSKMDTTGSILGIGTISNVVKTPTVNLAVEKSGRTTGLKTGSVQSVNTSVSVQYQKSCGSGKKFVVSYTNQVVVTPGSFSAAGDSGSLIVTNSTTCPQPVALLFAGSSSSTIGNPIGEVLSKVTAALNNGKSVSFVGANCGTAFAAPGDQMPELSQKAVEHANNILEVRRAELMSRPSVIGVGIGASDMDASKAAIVIYVDKTAGVTPRLPKRIKDVQVKVVFTDPFVAY